MHGGVRFLIGAVILVIAVGALGFLLWNISYYSEKCKTDHLEICKELEGPAFLVLLIVLTIAGLVILASSVVYILVTA